MALASGVVGTRLRLAVAPWPRFRFMAVDHHFRPCVSEPAVPVVLAVATASIVNCSKLEIHSPIMAAHNVTNSELGWRCCCLACCLAGATPES